MFDTMTKEREEQESAEAISSREAMQAVKQMLENLVSVVFLVARTVVCTRVTQTERAQIDDPRHHALCTTACSKTSAALSSTLS